MAKPIESTKPTEKYADELAEKVIDLMGKTWPIRRVRNSQLFTAMLGAAGLALFLVGIEKIFAPFSGWVSVGLGILFMAISGVLFRKLQ